MEAKLACPIGLGAGRPRLEAGRNAEVEEVVLGWYVRELVALAVEKRRSPASEKVPMMSKRTNQTMAATKIGTILVMVSELMAAVP